MCCMPCAICDISSRIGDCACMPFCVPGALLTARTRIRTLGGIEVSIQVHLEVHLASAVFMMLLK